MVARISRPYQLLIADDDPEFRVVLRTILQAHFRLIEACSGEEAVDMIARQPVDLALMDHHMEELSGLEAIQIVKRANAALPCILVTADATDRLKQTADEVDAYCVLSKPVSKRVLVHAVSAALQESYDDPEPTADRLPD